MPPRPIAFLCFLALSAATAWLPHTGGAAAGPASRVPGTATIAGPPSRAPGTATASRQAPGEQPRIIVGMAPDTGQYLPDTAVVARVGDRVIRVRHYIDSYFSSYAEFRPSPDSAGRVEFLNTMVNKEVLAHIARRVKRAETFEDRIVMRDHTQRVLSNVLLQRAVLDSVRVNQDEVRKIYAQMGYELRLKKLLFPRRDLAERVRADLVARRLTWKDAATRHSLPIAGDPDGELGWTKRGALEEAVATAVFDLAPGEISPVLVESAGYAVYQAVERREGPKLAFEAMRTLIVDNLRALQIGERSGRILAALREPIGMTHDSTNIAWVAPQFPQAFSTRGGGTALEFELDTRLPEFAPQDTSRVLARWRGGHQLTLGQFMSWFGDQSPFGRPSVNTFEALKHQIDILVLEPYMADLARARGLERDPMAVAMIEKRREQMMVEHLYQDSILARVRVSPAERRKYYRENAAGFMTYATVRYAGFHADSQADAESLAARLTAGVRAEDILRADSLAGRQRGGIQDRSQENHGAPYHKLLFEELRPGQVSVQGPDHEGHYAVLQPLSFAPGRMLSYQEAEAMIDESLQNVAAERLLQAFLRRHKKTMRIAARPEWVMHIRLVDPTI